MGSSGTILRFDGSAWVSEDSGTHAHLRSVILLGNGRVMAAGGDGTVLVRGDDGTWQGLKCPVGSNFTAAVALGEDRVLLPEGSTSLKEQLKARGFTIYDPDLSMITQGGGGVHCMCQSLIRDPV